MASDVRAVFFDLYDTLIGFDPPREVIQLRALEPFGLSADKSGFDAGYALADALMAEQTSRRPLSRLSAEAQLEFFARYEQLVLRGAGIEVDTGLAARIWHEVRKQEYGFALYPDVAPALEELRSRNVVTGVVTNMSRPGGDVARDMGFEGLVDFTLSSLDAGASKPSRRMFDAALERAGVTAAEAAHVGDQVETDIEGARASGIRPVLIDRHGANPGYDGCPRITSLAELPPVLNGLGC